MKVVEVLAVDQQVEHVVALSADLQPHLHPVQRRRLEELGRLERPEQIPAHDASRTVRTPSTSDGKPQGH